MRTSTSVAAASPRDAAMTAARTSSESRPQGAGRGGGGGIPTSRGPEVVLGVGSGDAAEVEASLALDAADVGDERGGLLAVPGAGLVPALARQRVEVGLALLVRVALLRVGIRRPRCRRPGVPGAVGGVRPVGVTGIVVPAKDWRSAEEELEEATPLEGVSAAAATHPETPPAPPFLPQGLRSSKE